MARTKRASLRRMLASLLTGALIAAGAVVGVAAPATAAVAPTITSTLAPRAGGDVDVTGAGFSTDAAGIYLGLRAIGSSTDVTGTTVWIDDANSDGTLPGLGKTAPMAADGSFTVTLPAPAHAADVSYEIVTRKAHGGDDPSQSVSAPLGYEAAPVAAPASTSISLAVTPGASSPLGTPVSLTAVVAPAVAGDVHFLDGATTLGVSPLVAGTATASFTTTALAEGAHALTAVFQPAQPALADPSSSLPVAHTVTGGSAAASVPAVPTVTVSQTSGLDPAGATVTVTGSGFVPAGTATNAARPPLAGRFAGAYVVFGSFLDDWKPTAGAASSARKVLAQKWGVAAGDMATIGGATQGAIEITPDGTFQTTLTVSEAAGLADGNWGIYTYPGGGVKYAPFETFTPISFAAPAPAPAVPTVTVSQTSGLDPAGATVTVTGSGFVPDGAATNGTRPPLLGFAGAYVVFGSFLDDWKPTAGAPSSARKVLAQKWGVHAGNMATIGGAAGGAIEIAPDGTFQTTLTVSEAAGLADGNWGIYTYPGGGAKYAPFETYTPITFAGGPVDAPQPTLALSTGSVQQGGTLTVDGTGFTPGQQATITVNSDPITLGVSTVSAAGSFSVSGTIPLSFPVGTHTVVAAVGGIALVSHTITVAAAPAAAVVETPPAPTCVARAVSGATIDWNVKQSFRTYIDGPIAKGSYSINWGSGSGAFSTETDRGRVSYGGAASFRGHGGLLDLQMSNPRVQVTGPSTANLIVNVRATNTSGEVVVNANGVHFATLSLPAANESGNRISWSGASATLTRAGAEAFGGFYGPGDALDPVSFSFPLGAEVECDAATGALAVTGGDAPVDVLWLGLGLLVIGAGVFALRRRVTA